MKCAKCNEEVGNLFCSKCRKEIEKKTSKIKFGKLIPLLYYDIENKYYIFGCTVKFCPCNKNGLCVSKHLFLPKALLHEFDGDNIISQNCG